MLRQRFLVIIVCCCVISVIWSYADLSLYPSLTWSEVVPASGTVLTSSWLYSSSSSTWLSSHAYDLFLPSFLANTNASFLSSSSAAYPHLRERSSYALANITYYDHASPDKTLHVVGVSQDHRTYYHQLQDYAVDFHEYKRNYTHARIFQFHASIHRDSSPKQENRDVEVWFPSLWPSSSSEGGEGEEEVEMTEETVAMRLASLNCYVHMTYPHEHFISLGRYNIDIVYRCVFDLPPEIIDRALCRGEHLRPECRVASFAVWWNKQVALFPLDLVLHFPDPVHIPALPRPANGYPTAPWAEALSKIKMSRASGPPAERKVCAQVPKQYSWTEDCVLWTLWTLDVVGVDAITIVVTSVDPGTLDNPSDMETIRASLAKHPGVNERVTLVYSDVPNEPETENSLSEVMVWDGFLRWQTQCDFVLVIDVDEYLQLFNSENNLERIDVKAYIASIDQWSWSSTYFTRRRLDRMTPAHLPEPLLPKLLTYLIETNNPWTTLKQLRDATGELFGKSLFRTNATIHPFIHFLLPHQPPPLRQQVGHIIHIRSITGIHNKLQPSAVSIERFMTPVEDPPVTDDPP